MPTNQGLTLDRYLSEKGTLEPARVVRIGIQVAQQMGSLSGSFLIHPGRILATKEGTVHLLPPPAEDLALPAMVELPAYASPEEIQGARPDIRAGLYSLGCTLFELLAGTPPFSGKDPKGVLRSHLEDPVPDVRDFSEAVSASLAETLSELLEKNPELRIQTPQELIRRLKQGLTAGPHAPGAPRPSRGPAHGAPARPVSAAPARGLASRVPRPMARGHRVPQAPFPPQRGASHRSLERASKLRPPAHLGTGPHGRHAASGEYEDEPRADLVLVRKKAYPFTIGGAALGLLLGIALVISKVRGAREEIPEMERRMVEQAEVEALKNRKESFAAEQKEKKNVVARQLTRLKTISDADKIDFLLQALPGLCDLPSGHLLGQALLELGPPPGTPGSSASLPEEADAAAAFKKQKEEAEALYAQGKLGDAITKIYDNYMDHKAHHGAEIDDCVEKWSNELTAKWKADVMETERLLLNSETGKAQEVLKKALVYGDGPIRKEAQQRIEAIQTQVAISQDDEKTQEGEGESDLEKQFQEQSEGSDSVDSNSDSGTDSGQGEGTPPDEGMEPEGGPPEGDGSGADGGPDPEESVGGDDPGGDASGDDS